MSAAARYETNAESGVGRSQTTAGRRLRAAGVALETRRAILGHANGDITTHYSAAEVAELIAAVNKIEGGESAPVLTLIRASDMGQNRGTKKEAA